MSLSNPTRPGAMSLLDKYAAINANIEEARRRVASTRSELESTQQRIENLQNDRRAMEGETTAANEELARLEEELKRSKIEHTEKLDEKQRIDAEYRLACDENSNAKRHIDSERLSFLERCREFRSSCKRMKVAATLLVLDGGGGGFDKEDDVWRRLQEDDDEESAPAKKRRGDDVEMERVAKDEKEQREAFIEAECALHAAKAEHEQAVERCDARNQKLTQQRAQLGRHRREVEELEREIGAVKDEIVKANQDAKSYENSWKRGQTPPNNSYNRAPNNGSYSNNFNPPDRNNYTPLHNSSSNHRCNSSGNVSNPYKSKPNNPYSRPNQSGGSNSSSGQYASEILRNSSKNAHDSTQQIQPLGTSSHAGQTQNRTWGSARNQRQFGTAVDISVDYSSSTSPKFSAKTNRVSLGTPASKNANDESSVSSASSDDDIISFDIFGKGK